MWQVDMLRSGMHTQITYCHAIYACLPVRYLRALNEEYGRRYGDTLVRAVEKEFSGVLETALKAMSTLIT